MEINAKLTLARQLLTDAVVAAGKKGKAAVAARLGYGRPLISRVLSPNDPLEMSSALADRIIDRYHVIPECPATNLAQPRLECLRLNAAKAPMHNPLAMRIWKVCQSCPHKPAQEVKSK
ncbi:MAG: hypothetical protein WAV95_15985 [Azonexus sp.]